ncbi:hypothetical protein P280DRAFT_318114 [Massarina eburnea CBS 473.64]|uniref:Uncharacterized protein n=1 Tax=Massarina eburnea CBS 473.64 TaxID=1395130 RepID=A0A6A6RIE0_9PLEO|nr:hypothetical protein P280DRAFT_318114 [Massarina eburnea CBS 473.64]
MVRLAGSLFSYSSFAFHILLLYLRPLTLSSLTPPPLIFFAWPTSIPTPLSSLSQPYLRFLSSCDLILVFAGPVQSPSLKGWALQKPSNTYLSLLPPIPRPSAINFGDNDSFKVALACVHSLGAA